MASNHPKLSELDRRRMHNEQMLKDHTLYRILQGDVDSVESKLNKLHRENKRIELIDTLRGDEENEIIMTVKVVVPY